MVNFKNNFSKKDHATNGIIDHKVEQELNFPFKIQFEMKMLIYITTFTYCMIYYMKKVEIMKEVFLSSIFHRNHAGRRSHDFIFQQQNHAAKNILYLMCLPHQQILNSVCQ